MSGDFALGLCLGLCLGAWATAMVIYILWHLKTTLDAYVKSVRGHATQPTLSQTGAPGLYTDTCPGGRPHTRRGWGE